MRSLLCLALLAVAESAVIGRKVNVPDSDATLLELIYKSALPKSNRQILDTVWWVPSGASYKATKVTVIEARKHYTTYSFQLVLQKSQCDLRRTAASLLRNCKPIHSSEKLFHSMAAAFDERCLQICKVTLAWFERDWTTIEIESYCSRK